MLYSQENNVTRPNQPGNQKKKNNSPQFEQKGEDSFRKKNQYFHYYVHGIKHGNQNDSIKHSEQMF
jgi:hypothetical protein